MGAKPKKNGSISYAKWGYIFIAPFFLIFAVFQLIPLGSTIYYSFFEYYRSGLASSRRSPSRCCWRPGSPTCA